MKDILNIFLELTVEDVPLFVSNNLNNLPPLSMANFDISQIIHDMEAMKMQLKNPPGGTRDITCSTCYTMSRSCTCRNQIPCSFYGDTTEPYDVTHTRWLPCEKLLGRRHDSCRPRDLS